MLHSTRFFATITALALSACVHTTGDQIPEEPVNTTKPVTTATPTTPSTTAKTKPPTATAAKLATTPPTLPATPTGEDDEIAFITSPNPTIDPTKALGKGTDDFMDMDERLSANKKSASEESEDARVERELREIHQAETKAAALQDQEDAQHRAEAVQKFHNEQDHLQEKMREDGERAKSVRGIDREELNWRGLED